MNKFWFVQVSTSDRWAVADPVVWSLENARQPLLEAARERLLTLDAHSDPERIVNVVLRRCGLNLVEIESPERVVVHYWTEMADLRLLFKEQQLARPEVQVAHVRHKNGTIVLQPGDDFLFGERLLRHWPWKLYLSKWQHRGEEEVDDWTVAPYTWSGFGWEGIKPNRIPWAALKSAWRRMTPLNCLNCDQPTILTNFGFPWSGMFNRYPKFRHACWQCRRAFEDHSVQDVWRWMMLHMDVKVLPDFDMIWDRPKKWVPPKPMPP